MQFYEKLKYLYRPGRFRRLLDKDEIRFILSYLKKNDCAIDIGAHKGAYTYWMQKAVGSGGLVYSFEPQKELADYLKKMVNLIDMNSVVVEHAALSSKEGTSVLHVPGVGVSPSATLESNILGNESKTYEVTMTTLDNYFSDKPVLDINLIKCDVEGHELEVFKGGEEILKNHKPLLIFECEQRHHKNDSIFDVFNYLHCLNYSGYFFLNGTVHEIEKFNPEIHQQHGTKDYVNNFLFSVDALRQI